MASIDNLVSLEHIECPLVRDVSDHWLGLRNGDGYPLISDYDVMQHHHQAPWVALADIIDGGADYRYRLVGTKYARILGEDMTGKLLGDAKNRDVAGRLNRAYGKVVETMTPVCIHGRVGRSDDLDGLHAEAAVLPLVDGDGSIKRLIHTIRLRTKDGAWMN